MMRRMQVSKRSAPLRSPAARLGSNTTVTMPRAISWAHASLVTPGAASFSQAKSAWIAGASAKSRKACGAALEPGTMGPFTSGRP